MEDVQKVLSIISKTDLEPRCLSAMIRKAGIDTPEKSVCCGVMSVCKAISEFGRTEVEKLLVLQLMRLERMLNVSKPMQTDALAEIAVMVTDIIVADDVEINLADLEIVFSRAAKGDYGKFYGGFGSAEVLGWFTDYLSEKAEAFVNFRERESSRYRTVDRRAGSREAERLAYHAAHLDYLKKKNEK